MANNKEIRRLKLKMRIRKNIYGTAQKPRLTVFRSNKEIYAQLIDDDNNVTLASASSMEKSFTKSGTKIDHAKFVGKLIAERAISVGIDSVVFDRNGYLYHGRVKSLADSAREGGLKF
ncbi:MAG: 50S ribosomal protein L18 [Bacteroidales bacterium]|jgi:large subunit ribosomal protein L18|nr:50S ribosomal protein L18 [Bacteroidales bacterium]MDD4001244.1 50S ribosomal protein L18 [Bacteroidales bacterium]MDD4528368.1 50S ribosomal protein L18 [Bacteroidales bacterium]MDD4829568.1 50S ribosomal protein L18 [Bacteroidales bacterium]